MSEAIWLEVPLYPGYWVSDCGRVRTRRLEKWKEMSLFAVGDYPGVNVTTPQGKRKLVYVHHLMSIAFLEHFPQKGHPTVVNHINGDRWDNRLENLELCSHRQNCLKGWACRPKTSQFPGVYRWDPPGGQRSYWKAQVRYNGRTIYLGLYEVEKEAAEAYQNFINLHTNTEIIKNPIPKISQP